MSKRLKLMVNEIGAVQPSARWTLEHPATGQIQVMGRPMDYWTLDGKPITPMQYREEEPAEETDTSDGAIPF